MGTDRTAACTFTFGDLAHCPLDVMSWSMPDSENHGWLSYVGDAANAETRILLTCVVPKDYRGLKVLHEMGIRVPDGTLTVIFETGGYAQYTFATFSGLVIKALDVIEAHGEQALTLSVSFQAVYMEYQTECRP